MPQTVLSERSHNTGKFRVEFTGPSYAMAAVLALVVFLAAGIWLFVRAQMRPVDDFYQPHGYIRRVNAMIEQGKIFYRSEKTSTGYRPIIHTENLDEEEEFFYRKSWLKEDIDAFNGGNTEVFLIEQGKLKGVNIYRHRIESPLAGDWNWWGRIFSGSAEGYAYLWNSRRTLKLYRPALQERALAKAGQSEFREVVYGRGHLFQTGFGISLKGRNNNRIADVYAMGENIVLKSYAGGCCYINGHEVPKGLEQRLDEGDLVQIYFSRTEREEFLFHDFSQKPLSFVNVLNGRQNRTNLDNSFHIIEPLTTAIETSVKQTRDQKKVEFDVHLALDEDISGLAQTSLDQFTRKLSSGKVRASCTIMEATSGRLLAIASTGGRDTNENLKLHPVGSATKVFLAAAATHTYPDLLQVRIDPHPAGEETNLLGYALKEGYKLRSHSPFPGENSYTDFPAYIAKSCNRYHAVLMALSLARDSAVAKAQPGQSETLLFTGDTVTSGNGNVYVADTPITNKPDLGYFVSARNDGRLECNNLESSEIALNLDRMFGVRRKFSEASDDVFVPDAWNLLFARLGLAQKPDLYPAFYSVMPETVNLGFNLNIDFRLDFISILFGGATNRWNNVKLAEATSRLVTDTKVEARFVQRLTENGSEMNETFSQEPLGMNPAVRQSLLQGMELVVAPGGTAGDLWPLLSGLKERSNNRYRIDFYAKTGTPFRKEIRKGEQEIYSSVLLFTAVLRNRATDKIEDALTFAIYIEDRGEHKAVDFLKQLLPGILGTRRWIQ